MSTKRSPRSLRAVVLVACGAGLGSGLLASAAEGFVYWTGAGLASNTAQANNDGSSPDIDFIADGQAQALAVDDEYIYWGDYPSESIARAELDGSNIEREFIPNVHPEFGASVTGLAVTDTHIFWSLYGSDRIGRASIDGSNANPNFVTGGSLITSIAVDGSHLYWTNAFHPDYLQEHGGHEGTIGRSALNGTGVDQTFVEGLSYGTFPSTFTAYPMSIAVDDDYIYVVLNGSDGPPEDMIPASIGRFSKPTGSPSDLTFIDGLPPGGAAGLAANDSHLYWAEIHPDHNAIARASIDGTQVRHNFICNADGSQGNVTAAPVGIAVDAGHQSGSPSNDDECLLQEYVPELRYDSQESYRADSAATIAEAWGDEASGLFSHEISGDPWTNRLVRNPLIDPPFDLAYASPYATGDFQLDLAALGATYPDNTSATVYDRLVEHGDDYLGTAQALHDYGGYANRVYGHVTTDTDGKTWLQYWFFYYYNAFNVSNVGKHEGDWEMIQVGLDQNGEPDGIVFAQHEAASYCEVSEAEMTAAGAPVVFVGLDSHASFPSTGTWDLPHPLAPTDDQADGDGDAVRPQLEIIDNGNPAWVDWPGLWGNSEGGGFGQPSPAGPAWHDQWEDPETFADGADDCFDRYEGTGNPRSTVNRPSGSADHGPRAPRLTDARFVGDRVRVSYTLRQEPGKRWPRILFSTDSPGDDHAPVSLVAKGLRKRGKFTFPTRTTPSAERLVRASVFSRGGGRSRVVERTIARPGAVSPR